jgi:hypothetical protein
MTLRVPRSNASASPGASRCNWLLGADHSPLENTIAYEQLAIEVTAALAQNEPDPYLAQVYRFGLQEDFDHLYRYAALLDRLEGKDANNILQCYTDILPGRPTAVEHRAPDDDPLAQEVGLRANGTQIVPPEQDSRLSQDYRDYMNSEGSPTNTVAQGYVWVPGTELNRMPARLH